MDHLTDQQFHLYLDDELDAHDRAHAERHLATCSACQHELSQLSTMFSMIKEFPALELGAGLAPAVLAAIRTSPHSMAPPLPALDSARWPFRAWVALAAQLTCALALGVWSIPILVAALAQLQAGITSVQINPIGITAALLDTSIPMQSSIAALQRVLETPMPAPFGQLGLIEWTTIVALVSIVWLVCNRVLLNMPCSAQAGQQEVAS